LGYNPEIAKFIVKNKGGVLIFTRSFDIVTQGKDVGKMKYINSCNRLDVMGSEE